MHTVQLVLIQCKDQDLKDMADLTDKVETNLDSIGNDRWWDWWQIGGRWEDYLKEQIAPMIWPESLESPVALRLTKDNTQMALKLLKIAKDQQDVRLLSYISTLKRMGVDLNEYILTTEPDEEGWQIPGYIRDIFAIRNGDWSYDSGFVDCVRWGSAKVGDLINYLENPEEAKNHWDLDIENYALVVVDFHC